ncbi:MAG TPA: HAD-IA family hydrolase [Dehalococcoidales bacterium]|jgi:phosphoglycolate phosphatase|nr:HAD-IA family hydrolase [Dehalococcoidales bacterium]
MKNHFTSVIFDFDYTLADSSAGEVECVNYALLAMHLPPASKYDIYKMIGVSLPETFKILTGGSNKSRTDEFINLFIQRADDVMLDYIVLFDSVRPTIQKLSESGITLSIVSTKYRRRIEAFLKREDLTHSIKVIVGGEDVAAHKPDPTGLLMAIEKLGHGSAQTIYVGDSVVDAETAKRANVPFVAVLSGVTTKDAFRDYAPFAVIGNLQMLPPLLLK